MISEVVTAPESHELDVSFRTGRRQLVLGAGVLSVAFATGCSTQAQGGGLSTLAKGDPVRVDIELLWQDGKGVEGASVFLHDANQLLGKTDKSGRLSVTAPEGSVLRLVEPNYGRQQALKYVQGNRKPGVAGKVTLLGEMWVLG